jgi:hypothetical protein
MDKGCCYEYGTRKERIRAVGVMNIAEENHVQKKIPPRFGLSLSWIFNFRLI